MKSPLKVEHGIIAGLEEALRFARGEETGARVTVYEISDDEAEQDKGAAIIPSPRTPKKRA